MITRNNLLYLDEQCVFIAAQSQETVYSLIIFCSFAIVEHNIAIIFMSVIMVQDWQNLVSVFTEISRRECGSFYYFLHACACSCTDRYACL